MEALLLVLLRAVDEHATRVVAGASFADERRDQRLLRERVSSCRALSGVAGTQTAAGPGALVPFEANLDAVRERHRSAKA